MTRRKIIVRDAPSASAACTLRRPTPRTACIELIDRIGNSASTMITTFATSPMPNQMISNGSSASLGIGRVISIGGSSTALTVSFMPIHRPSGTATSTVNTKARPKRNRLMPR